MSCPKWGVPQNSNINRDDAEKSLDLLVFFHSFAVCLPVPIFFGNRDMTMGLQLIQAGAS